MNPCFKQSNKKVLGKYTKKTSNLSNYSLTSKTVTDRPTYSRSKEEKVKINALRKTKQNETKTQFQVFIPILINQLCQGFRILGKYQMPVKTYNLIYLSFQINFNLCWGVTLRSLTQLYLLVISYMYRFEIFFNSKLKQNTKVGMGMRGKIFSYLGLLKLKFIYIQKVHSSYKKHVIFKVLLLSTKAKNSASKFIAIIILATTKIGSE